MPRKDDPHPYIERCREAGMRDPVIFKRLLLEGWAAQDVAPLFSEASLPLGASAQAVRLDAPAAAPAKPAETSAPMHPARRFKWAHAVLAVVIIVAAATSASALYMFLRPAYVYSISLPAASTTATAQLTYGALPALSDPDYYANIKRNLTAQRVSFVDADLSSMRLTVYIEGTSTLQVPILAKGKSGSWWETPAGIYQIQTKERDHFSTFGEVNQPYSMQFQGNFFIHGWPTYPDGTPVSSSYSGGCVRLSTDDAQKVFELARIGMPVVVYDERTPGDGFDYQLKAPTISASNYLVADLTNGTVLASKDASSTAPIASITKLVTALVATEYINLDKELVVPSEAAVYTSIPRLKAGKHVRAYDLLFLLLQESSNEAAETLAAARGREQFVAAMNDKAAAIGLSRTAFSDPSGAKDDVSSAEDLFTLLKYINESRRFVFGITSGEITDSAYGAPAFRDIENFNLIKNSPVKLLGGKIGQTNEAGETYAGIFSVRIGGQERPVAVIVLGARDAQSDVARLLNFVHSAYLPASD